MSRDVLITGIPRSGTTLTCQLLNLLPDTVALDEPMETKLLQIAPEDVPAVVRSFCEEMRESLLARQRAVTKHVQGAVSAARFSAVLAANGLRKPLDERGEISFAKPLSPNFLLAVKHPAVFTAHAQVLSQSFPLFAVVRNPLPVLASWQTVAVPVQQGHLHAAERIDTRLRARLETIEDRLDRQLALLDWLFGQYAQHVAPERILRYEEIVESGGRALRAIAPAAEELAEPLASRNASYGRGRLRKLGERLLASEGAYWRFYDRLSVERIAP
jgi:hypothetical protein